METKIALFEQRQVRKIIFNNEWWFVVEDIVVVLTESTNPKDYISKIKRRDIQLHKGWGQLVRTLRVNTSGGAQKINCVNTQGALRIIQSIPSLKAEPFKQRLAKVGYERIQEIEDPELALKRMKSIYEAKGYPKDWIDKRQRGIAVRNTLTDEWKTRGVKEGKEFGILTDEIYNATFGLTAKEYKDLKGIDRQNLRDHMDDLELIFTMLGEASTTEITKIKDAKGLDDCKTASQKGGKIAGDARKNLEIETNKKIVNKNNYSQITE